MLKLFHLSILSLFLFTSYKDELVKLSDPCVPRDQVYCWIWEGEARMQTYSRNKPLTIWAKTMWVPRREREALLLVLVEERGQVTDDREHM